jgi:hypothetical protein
MGVRGRIDPGTVAGIIAVLVLALMGAAAILTRLP